jgi:hypothetical protein
LTDPGLLATGTLDDPIASMPDGDPEELAATFGADPSTDGFVLDDFWIWFFE